MKYFKITLFLFLVFINNLFAENCGNLKEKGEPSWSDTTPITSVDRLAQMFREGLNLPERTSVGSRIYGRVLRGHSKSDFATMTNDPLRKIVFFTGSRGLEKLMGKTHYEILVELGFPEKYISDLVQKGTSFKYIIFESNLDVLRATWKNIATLVGKVSKAAQKKVLDRVKELESKNFEEIQREKPEMDLAEIYNEGRDHPNFMSMERFIASSGSLFDVRAFLYHEFNVNSQFKGDGFTRDGRGRIGVEEFIGLNLKVSSLANYTMVNLDL